MGPKRRTPSRRSAVGTPDRQPVSLGTGILSCGAVEARGPAAVLLLAAGCPPVQARDASPRGTKHNPGRSDGHHKRTGPVHHRGKGGVGEGAAVFVPVDPIDVQANLNGWVFDRRAWAGVPLSPVTQRPAVMTHCGAIGLAVQRWPGDPPAPSTHIAGTRGNTPS